MTTTRTPGATAGATPGAAPGATTAPRPARVVPVTPASTGTRSRRYTNPYLAGVGLGLVLLAAFVLMGRGLGASGAFTSMVAAAVASVAPDHAAANGLFGHYLGAGSPLRDWLVIEILGVTLGGLLSALLAGRFRIAIERGAGVGDRGRLLLAFGGGTVMGVGAKLARGCTSGQALTGGAVLSVGSWLFIIGAFGAGYLAAPLFRRQWL